MYTCNAGDERVTGLKTVEEAKQLFTELFPTLAAWVTDESYERFVNKPVSTFPRFTFIGPQLHYNEKVVLLGDSIKTVKPYFGQGVNSGFEDVSEFISSLVCLTLWVC